MEDGILMSYSAALLPEFDQEMASTRKVLERLPEDRFEWKAHPRSHTLGWNANHLADLPQWAVMTLGAPSMDLAPAGGTAYRTPSLTTRREVLDLFDRNVAAARAAIASATDKDAAQPWTLLKAGAAIFTMPRAAVIRSFVLNHIIHHRAIVCAYLRLLEVPVPGMYGPSGDE
jgi:uncharacterized damage-inducible protein DinB